MPLPTLPVPLPTPDAAAILAALHALAEFVEAHRELLPRIHVEAQVGPARVSLTIEVPS